MSDGDKDLDEKGVVDKLRALRPRVPEEAQFWNDFSREVRRAYEARPRRRWWLWMVPLPLAAVAALYLVIVPRGGPAPTPAPAAEPAPTRQVAPLPPPDDVDELPDEVLDDVLGELDEDANDGDGDEIDIEDLNDDDVRLLYEALKGA
jgi:hypothetical protein